MCRRMNMPYRINPKNSKEVQVKKNNKWQKLKGGGHETSAQARSHLTALNINVHHKKGK